MDLVQSQHILSPVVLKLLLRGILPLILAALDGIIGGYVMYFWYKGKFNPMIGVAGVSCIPTTAKLVQKIAANANPSVMILPHALGANISSVITAPSLPAFA